jgi:hypothetical protein
MTTNRLYRAVIAITVSLFAGMLLGSGAFGVNTGWNGFVNYNTSSMTFAFIQADTGLLNSSRCNASSADNPNFFGAANRVDDNGDPVNVFWLLTSHTFGVNTCGWGGSAHAWGVEQAETMFEVIDDSGYAGPVDRLFADVERFGGETCSTDLTRWECDSAATNRAVVKGV